MTNVIKVVGINVGTKAIGHMHYQPKYSWLNCNAATRKVISSVYPQLKGCKTLLTGDVPEYLMQYAPVAVELDMALVNAAIADARAAMGR
jgi:hypothetical protein